MCWFPRNNCPNMYLQKSSLGGGGERIGSLASQLRILDDEFKEIPTEGKIIKVLSLY